MIQKTEILESLREKYAKNSQISERTINEVLETLMPIVTEETSVEDFLKIADPVFNTIAGNVRKDVADALRKAKETKPAPKDEPKKEEEPQDEDEPKWVKSLMQKFESYDQRFAEEDKRRTAEQVRKSAFAKANIYPQNVLEVAADGFDFGQENAEATFIEKAARTAGKFGIVPEKGEPRDKKPTFDALRAELDAQAEMIN
ncbi:hypothetical protein DSECCO2_269100 [anaerobic digester metagenome]